VTILSLVFEAYLPPLYESLGIYLPLIVVNCIILGRAEAFASKSTVLMSIADAIGIGIGFTISMLLVSIFREILGTGKLAVFGKTIFSIPVLSESPLAFFIMPPGAFLVLGLLLGLFRWMGVLKSE
jgi:electron transport complex protein RnfE